MITLETTITAPFTVLESGQIRITGTRVPIDSVLYHYKLGATPEQIACKFQGLRLADIHVTIAYYLNNRVAVEEYLRQQEAKGDALRRKLESDPTYQTAMSEMRDRLLARWAAQQQELSTSVTN